ncbi:MAG: phage holin family protein [Candidatus Limisoma sp.]
METLNLSPETATRVTWLAITVCIEYLLVLLAIGGDMVSGIRKARSRGECTRSSALRRTVDKAATYYNLLVVLTVVDAMQITAVLLLRNIESYDLPTIPLFTLIGSVGMACIEVKSIFENANKKRQNDVAEILNAIEKLSHSESVKELLRACLKNES